jgi:glycosyltransferase involved in cell wall biosynthesis
MEPLDMPRISIGLPIYNRPELLALTLENLRTQTFQDFEVIISDNASPDPRVMKICEEMSALDARFRYIRQRMNLGASANFSLVYQEARAPFFMWAADDDLRPSDFIERGVEALELHSEASAWFCELVNINKNGDIVREIPSYKRFQSTEYKIADLTRFLWEPEIMGKANPIYGIFRREALAELIELFRDHLLDWGADANLMYGYLCRSNLLIDDSLIFQKRVPDESLEPVLNPRLHIYPPEERAIYFKNYRRAAAGTGYWPLTVAVLGVRSIYDYWGAGRARQDCKSLARPLFRLFSRVRARLLGAGG